MDVKEELLKEVEDEVAICQKCQLCKGRKNTVFGVGNLNSNIMLIGEGPGADEDIQGGWSS